jgi:pimeloyl-ACP methyl ester carboxylesterase
VLVAAPDTHLAVAEAGSGRPIVMVHGGTGTGEFDWAPVVPILAERFRVVTFDLRGHGASPAPGMRIGIVRYGLDTHHVMRSLGIPRALLVGFSAGANSLLTLTIRRPELAVGLVTIGGSVTSDLKAIDHVAGGGPDHWEDLRAALAHDWAENNVFTREMLARVTCPVLAVHGERDRIVFPEQADLLASHVPNGRVWMAPNATHLVQKDVPEAFARRVLDFAETLPW